jgi:tetratricopeptide (TPR) repeat protein
VRHFIIYVALLILVSGCAGKMGDDFRASLGLVNAYKDAQIAFNHGQVMEARKKLLSIKEGEKDYDKAIIFLTDEVEPARLKLLRYFSSKGKKEEGRGNWAQAEEAYAIASEHSLQSQSLERYKKNMNMKVRQLRFDSMYQQRQKEDNAWTTWQDSGYIPPKGLFGDDAMFANAREDVSEAVDQRIKTTWKRAEMYRDDDLPEIAWLYADSYLRLYPGDKNAQDLKNAMATALPKGFKLPKDKKSVAKIKRTKVVKTEVTSTQVKSLMKQEKWQRAQKEALNLRKKGHADADKLLAKIDAKISNLAEHAYQKGNLAFRLENIDAAVKFWQQAVDLKPSEQTYLDSLRRGEQIQESLNALKLEGKK